MKKRIKVFSKNADMNYKEKDDLLYMIFQRSDGT